MSLTHTFVQTHRHFIDEQLSYFSVKEARVREYPLESDAIRTEHYSTPTTLCSTSA